jgi:DNA-binding NarL/FixJ family response regulator
MTQLLASPGGTQVKEVRRRIVLADDHPDILRRVSGMLTPQFDVVAMVGDGRSAVEAVHRLNPDILLLDVAMPEMDGMHAALEVRDIGSSTKIIFLSMHQEEDYVAAALQAGAHGYVFKSRMRADLLVAIERVFAGSVFISTHSGGHII